MKTGLFFFSSRRRHTRYWRDWSSDVCSSDLSSASSTLHSHSCRFRSTPQPEHIPLQSSLHTTFSGKLLDKVAFTISSKSTSLEFIENTSTSSYSPSSYSSLIRYAIISYSSELSTSLRHLAHLSI